MSNINDANLLEMFEELWESDVCVCEDFGLWESLTADTLSPSETRLLAEHLKDCPACRQRCADARELGVFEDSPLYDRIRAYKAKPASETDEDWKTIAAEFESAKKGGANENDGQSAPRTQTGSAWGRFFQNKRASLGVACSAAAALAVVAALTWGPNDPDVPELANNARPQIDEDPGTLSLSELISQLDARTDSLTQEPSDEKGDDEGSKSTAFGASKGLRAPQTPMFDLRVLNLLAPQYNEAVDSFNNGDYASAAQNFECLVDELKKDKSVDAETIDGAYWNWGVATLNGGDKKKAEKIFRDLKKRNLSAEMREMTEAALAECQN